MKGFEEGKQKANEEKNKQRQGIEYLARILFIA